MMIALIGGLKLDGMSLRQEATFTIDNNGLKGWMDGPGVRGARVARPLAHGDYVLPVFREARVISVQGQINTNSDFSQDESIRQLTGLFAEGRERLSVATADGTMWADVDLSDGPQVDIVRLGTTARYRLVMRAADPRLYSERRSFTGGTVQVHHMGNFPAAPAVTVAGPRSAPYTISGPGGRQVVVSQSLSAGQTHRIDFASGGLFRDGVRQVSALTKYQAWTIPPGRGVSMSISAGSMTVEVTDTHI